MTREDIAACIAICAKDIQDLFDTMPQALSESDEGLALRDIQQRCSYLYLDITFKSLF